MYGKSLILSPLVIFPATLFLFMFLDVFIYKSLPRFGDIWHFFLPVSIGGVVVAFQLNLIIGLPVLYFLNKLKKLNFWYITICSLILAVVLPWLVSGHQILGAVNKAPFKTVYTPFLIFYYVYIINICNLCMFSGKQKYNKSINQDK